MLKYYIKTNINNKETFVEVNKNWNNDTIGVCTRACTMCHPDDRTAELAQCTNLEKQKTCMFFKEVDLE